VTGGWITQADRSRGQQRAAAELAAILAAHPDLPLLAWTVTASAGGLAGQVLAPAAGRLARTVKPAARAVDGLAPGAAATRMCPPISSTRARMLESPLPARTSPVPRPSSPRSPRNSVRSPSPWSPNLSRLKDPSAASRPTWA